MFLAFATTQSHGISPAVPVLCGLFSAFGWYGVRHVWRSGPLSARSGLSQRKRRDFAITAPTAAGMFTLWTIGSAVDAASGGRGLVWVLLAFFALAGGSIGGIVMLVSLTYLGRPYWAIPPSMRPRSVRLRAGQRRERSASSNSKRRSGSSSASPSSSRSRRSR